MRILPFIIFYLVTNFLLANQSELVLSKIDNWVKTEQIISKEISEWKTEKELLIQTESLLKSEIERLDLEIGDLNDSATASDEKRESLTVDKDNLKNAADVISSSIGILETDIKNILPSLPEPLIEKIKPLIRRIPDDPSSTDLSLGQRTQNIVGILSQTDKFNTTISLSSETKEIKDGKIAQITILYMGLAGAYYVDESGQYAGIGIPTKEGWDWPLVDGIGEKIKKMVEIYEGSGTVEFIEAPAQTKTL